MSEIWYFNASPKALGTQGTSYSVGFTSNGTHYTILRNGTVFKEKFYLYYNDTEAYKSGWKNTAFRTVTFDEAPTGDLLTYLEANATKLEAEPFEFKRYYKNDALIGTGTYKFRHYSATEPVATVYTLSGKWKLGESEAIFTNPDWYYTQTINFTSNGSSFTGITVNSESAAVESRMWYINGSTQTIVFGKEYSGVWVNTAYCNIDFGTTPQTVTEEFYNWFVENATYQGYTVKVTHWDEGYAHADATRIKFNTPPTSNDDYDYTTGCSYDDTNLYNSDGGSVTEPVTVQHVQKIYIFSGDVTSDSGYGGYGNGGAYKIGSGEAVWWSGSDHIYSSPIVIEPTEGMVISICHCQD